MLVSILYVSDAGTELGIEENRIVAHYPDGMKRTIPIETVESITLLTKAHISVPCMEACLKRGISVSFFSKGGRYFGRLLSTGHVNAALQRKQSALYDTPFALALAKRIIHAKTRNQIVVLRRYAHSRGVDVEDLISKMLVFGKKLDTADTMEQLSGYEGQCAKLYFRGLARCIEPEFAFHGRSRRPPMDEFNSLISLGYSILMNEIYAEIENKGLNPYFGFMHRDAENHPTLASDIIEEWRAVLIDSMAMSLINGHEISKEDFRMGDDEHPGCFLTKNGLNIFLKKLEKKLQSQVKYLSYVSNAISFRRAIALQLGRLSEAIRREEAISGNIAIVRTAYVFIVFMEGGRSISGDGRKRRRMRRW